MEAGGSIYVCSACFKKRGLDENSLVDSGDRDSGNGLLLLIRKHIDPLTPRQLLEILRTESSVVEDLPACYRLTQSDQVYHIQRGKQNSFLVSKGPREQQQKEIGQKLPSSDLPQPSHTTQKKREKRPRTSRGDREQAPFTQPIKEVEIAAELPAPQPAPAITPLSVMNIDSWPRPPWLLRALNDHLERRMSDEEFAQTADVALRLAFSAQQRDDASVFTDGEQRRDNYGIFVGGLLENCQLIPITDLLPYVENPEEMERELCAFDVPAGKIHHPAVFGPLWRSRSLGVHAGEFLRSFTQAPLKIAIPGAYLLTRTIWMECISDGAYEYREDLPTAIVRVSREELHFLLAWSVAIVQINEPVLTEVAFSGKIKHHTSMCEWLGDKRGAAEELAFAESLIQQLIAGLPRERLTLHICRGNWTQGKSAALAGDYRLLVPLLQKLEVGRPFLELCTPRAGDAEVLRALPKTSRIGVGVISEKCQSLESVEEVLAAAATLLQERYKVSA